MLILFGDKIRSQSKPFLYLFQLVAAKDPVHVWILPSSMVIGIGCSGCNSIEGMPRENLDGVGFIAIDADPIALDTES